MKVLEPRDLRMSFRVRNPRTSAACSLGFDEGGI